MGLRLRLATFNLESLDDRPERPLAQRIEILRPQLLRLRADVLCLQEVNAQRADRRTPRGLHALDRLLAETPYARFHRFASASRESGEP
ncbi:MAG: endonuclease/exonuclease/phosphatase family protein, partial [Alphaproteobacteria bacterium]